MGIYLILAIVGIVLLAVFTYRLASTSSTVKTTLNVVYTLIIIVLAYFLYQSVMEPIKFEKAKKLRYKVTIERLKKLRDIEDAFKAKYDRYTANKDSLVDFVKNDSLVIIKAIGMVPDSLAMKYSLKKAEKLALERELIKRDTIRVSVKDSLLKDIPADSVVYIPNRKHEFEFAAGILVTMSQTKEPVFEIKAHNDLILEGLDRQMIVNLNDSRKKNDKYPGLKVGSLTELIKSGNWE